MATAIEIDAREQDILIDRWTAKIRFNPFYNFWFYDLYEGDQAILVGQKLEIDSIPVQLTHYPFPKLFLVDTEPESKQPIDIINDFGKRLELCQTDYEEE